jgi:exopolyphosphatase/guanosine-5'-triphosphate,3'-diphosphate pyrophosphatase
MMSFPLRVASIDVGSNALRLLAAEFADGQHFSSLAYERAPVRLAQGVFVSGRLAPAVIQPALQALAGFQRRLQSLGIEHYRAVGTSALRESADAAEFVGRVQSELGLELEVISGFEEARLVHLAVLHRMRLGRKLWMLADVGGGSVELSLVDDEGIVWSETHTMGTVRLLEELSQAGAEPARFSRLLEQYIATLSIPPRLRHRSLAGFIATGGNIGSLLRLAGDHATRDGVGVVSVARLGKIARQLSRMSVAERVEQLGLRTDRADVILPAAMLYGRLAELAGTEQILVPRVGLREGLVLDVVRALANPKTHREDACARADGGRDRARRSFRLRPAARRPSRGARLVTLRSIRGRASARPE